jgi:hypothetical protein
MDTATSKPRKATPAGPDRLSSGLFVLAAFLAVLALLSWQLKLSARASTGSVILLRRVYQTRVIETIGGPSRRAPAVSESVSSSGSAPSPTAPPTTASSSASVP